MSEYRFEVRLTGADRESAELMHAPLAQWADMCNAQTAADKTKVEIGPLVEIETCQLVGVKDGREVDLGDIPLTPEMKAREIAREYGENPDSDDAFIMGAMDALIDWMRKQGKLK